MAASKKREKRKERRRIAEKQNGYTSVRGWKCAPFLARTDNQKDHVELMRTSEVVVAIGNAGCGKTYLSVGHAVKSLSEGKVSKIVFIRSVEEVGKSLGTLPGEVDDKIGWAARPFLELVTDFTNKGIMECCLKNGQIEHIPVAHIRGVTFPDNTIVIIDECQNMSPVELKAVLTRVGNNNQVIICGDHVHQKDIRGESALEWFLRNNKKQGNRFPVIEYGIEDCQRSSLCKEFLTFFEKCD